MLHGQLRAAGLESVASRSTRGLLAKIYALTVAAFLLWVAYGLLRGDWAIIVPNSICLLLSLFILAMILLPGKRREDVANTIEHSVSGH